MELERVLCQVVRLEVRSIRDWNSIEKRHMEKSLIFCWFWKSDVDLSTPNRCHSFHVDSLFIVDEISTNVWRGNSICWIHGELTKMRSLGNCSKNFNRICISFIFNFSKVNTLFQRFIAFAWKAKHFALVCFPHLLLLDDFSGISGNSEQKNIFQTIEHLIQLSYLLL